jgi:hypothetical protein
MYGRRVYKYRTGKYCGTRQCLETFGIFYENVVTNNLPEMLRVSNRMESAELRIYKKFKIKN